MRPLDVGEVDDGLLNEPDKSTAMDQPGRAPRAISDPPPAASRAR